MSDSGREGASGQEQPAAPVSAPKRAGGRPGRPATAFFKIVEGAERPGLKGHKPDRLCDKCKDPQKGLIARAEAHDMKQHLLDVCEKFTAAERKQLREDEAAYTLKYDKKVTLLAASAAGGSSSSKQSAGSKRPFSAISGVSSSSQQPPAKQLVQSSMRNFGYANAREGDAGSKVVNRTTILHQAVKWTACSGARVDAVVVYRGCCGCRCVVRGIY